MCITRKAKATKNRFLFIGVDIFWLFAQHITFLFVSYAGFLSGTGARMRLLYVSMIQHTAHTHVIHMLRTKSTIYSLNYVGFRQQGNNKE